MYVSTCSYASLKHTLIFPRLYSMSSPSFEFPMTLAHDYIPNRSQLIRFSCVLSWHFPRVFSIINARAISDLNGHTPMMHGLGSAGSVPVVTLLLNARAGR